MAARLMDAQKKKIVADYAELGTYAAAGRANGVSDKTVKSIVFADPETSRISEQKKKQNILDMLQYMDDRRKKAQEVMDAYLDAMSDPKKNRKSEAVRDCNGFRHHN